MPEAPAVDSLLHSNLRFRHPAGVPSALHAFQPRSASGPGSLDVNIWELMHLCPLYGFYRVMIGFFGLSYGCSRTNISFSGADLNITKLSSISDTPRNAEASCSMATSGNKRERAMRIGEQGELGAISNSTAWLSRRLPPSLPSENGRSTEPDGFRPRSRRRSQADADRPTRIDKCRKREAKQLVTAIRRDDQVELNAMKRAATCRSHWPWDRGTAGVSERRRRPRPPLLRDWAEKDSHWCSA